MIIKKCKGCGALLQDEFSEKAGFIPKLTLESKYCKRCFRMMHYNELPKIVASNEDYEKVIDSVIAKNGLIVFVVDLFAFKATFNKKMIDKIRNKNVILVANKYDVLPKSTNISNVVEWLSRQCEKVFFKVDAIHIVSSKKGYYIDDLTRTIDMARKERDVYFVGCANVGKSSLINALLKKNTSIKDDVISTSNIPGTTLNEIRIPFFEDNKAFIDTPGLINNSDVLNQLLPNTYNKIIPNDEMKPITYQITNDNAIFLAGLASIEFKCKERISVIVYASKNLYIHRCKSSNVDNLYQTQLGKLLNPPMEEEIKNLKYTDMNINLDGRAKQNIWFSGFGFVSVIGECECKVKYLDKTEVYVTDAII
ncbi:MAG: ribosome biogenesis GTPase YqeH [Acholeplasmatales bacterium]|nr:ribosome biogenesis GTPase YqeH [Acholeplasmatales bacterium]